MNNQSLKPLPDISIVVPFYNGEKFLPHLTGSLLASLKASSGNLSVELIVIIDSPGSDISTVSALLGRVLDETCPVRQIILKNDVNLGVAASRMTGQSVATGRFLTFIDQDDYVGLPYFSVLEKNLSDKFSFFLLNGDLEYESEQTHRPILYYHNKLSFNKIARANFLITPSLLVFNTGRVHCDFRQVSARHPGSDDWACYLALLSDKSVKYKFIGDRIIHYVIHEENYHHDKFNFLVSQVRTIEYFQRKFPANRTLKIKHLSLQFRLKLNLSMIRISRLTRGDVAGFVSLAYIELTSINNLIWLFRRFRAAAPAGRHQS
ncbi:MAG: glycosyltransferase [Bacteroidota bacterium]